MHWKADSKPLDHQGSPWNEQSSVVSVLVPIPIGSEVLELFKHLWLLAFLVLQNGDGDSGTAACHNKIEVL